MRHLNLTCQENNKECQVLLHDEDKAHFIDGILYLIDCGLTIKIEEAKEDKTKWVVPANDIGEFFAGERDH